jgi:hypothetical protein
MTLRHIDFAQLRTMLMAASVGAAIALWTATPARTLGDAQQILTGGVFATAAATIFTGPGVPFAQLASDLGGRGENAASVRVPAGTASGLRVRATSESSPSGGNLVVTVRKNGADTALTCTAPSTTPNAVCADIADTVAFANNDRMSVKIVNSLTGATTTKVTFSLVFD